MLCIESNPAHVSRLQHLFDGSIAEFVFDYHFDLHLPSVRLDLECLHGRESVAQCLFMDGPIDDEDAD